MPARRLSGADLSGVLGESGRTFTDSRSETLRSAFVIAQISLTVVVLAAATLLVKSLLRVLSNGSGFTRQNILSMDIPLSASRYPDAQRQSAFFEQALSRVQALPGVITAAIVDSAPFTQSANASPRSKMNPCITSVHWWSRQPAPQALDIWRLWAFRCELAAG